MILHWGSRLPVGMAYVMLGRCEKLEDLYITGEFDPGQIRCHPDALEEAQRLDAIAFERLMEQQKLEEKSLIISYVNVRSLREHLPDVLTEPILMKSNLLGLGETWLYEGETVEIPNMISTFVSSGKGKGLAAFTKETCMTECLQRTDASGIFIKHENINVIFLYLTKGFDWTNLHEFLENVIDPEEPTVIMGDVNWHYPDNHLMKTYLQVKGFTQLIMKATHQDGRCIDHLYISEQLKDTSIEVQQNSTYYSDHDIISLFVPKQ